MLFWGPAEDGWVIMSQELQILHLEDDSDDTEIVRSLLEAENIVCNIHRVQTRPGFKTALETGGWHLIISDFGLPSFDGMKALDQLLETLHHVLENPPGLPPQA